MNAIASFTHMFSARGELIRELMWRELKDKHTGQILGSLWAFGHPLILMIIYTILFAYVFPARFGSAGSIQDYAPCVLASIVPWLAFQSVLGQSPSILINHSSLVSQIVFPTEILPVKSTLASVFPYIVGVFFAVVYSAMHGRISWMAFTLPWLIICQLAAMLGAAFLLAVLGIVMRDIRDIIIVFCTLNLFAQPILYNPFSTPKILHLIFIFNPFSYIVWCWQDALFFGKFAHPIAWVVFPVISFLSLIFGWTVYKRSQQTFGDLL